jgi:two-component sensor histidine kinase
MPTLREKLERFRRQQGILAEFGIHALRTDDIDSLLQRATELISQAVGNEIVKILELLPDGSLLVKAGVGWAPGVVGHAVIEGDSGSAPGRAIAAGVPVISLDIDREKRFKIPGLLKDHGIKSSCNVLIQGKEKPYGVLEVDARQRIEFGQDDINFLQNYANLIGAAIERKQADDKIAEASRKTSIALRELQHRTKNMLMKIQAIASRTRLSSASIDEFVENFGARLRSLARAQDLLAKGTRDSVRLREILVKELDAEGVAEGEGLELAGEDLWVPGHDVWALSLLFHELVTNAEKHGAIRFNGKVTVSWRREEDGALRLTWRETGVPIGGPPSRKSFGSEVIQEIVPDTLGGKGSVRYHPDGLQYVLEFPLPPLTPRQS